MKLSPKMELQFEQAVRREMLRFLKEQEETIPTTEEDPLTLPAEEPVEAPVETPAEAPVEEVEVEDSMDVPTGFPEDGILTVVKAMVTMGLTSAIRDMSDDLAGSYPELEDLSMDIQLRLIEALSSPEAIDKAANAIAKLVKFGRENLISSKKD
jgi:hypothetical protein